MEVFIGNLPESATVDDLVDFFKAFARDAEFRIVRKQGEDGTRYRFGLAHFRSDRKAEKAIHKLHMHKMHGKPIVVREYHHRAYQNERRAVGWRNRPWDGPERRKGDRRHGSVELRQREEPEVVVEGYRALARKL